VTQLREALPTDVEIVALGTNAIATQKMSVQTLAEHQIGGKLRVVQLGGDQEFGQQFLNR
jgi:hypothetical protein